MVMNDAGTAPKSFDTIIPAMLGAIEEGLGNGGAWLIGLVLILVLAASKSTLSSLAMTSASTITCIVSTDKFYSISYNFGNPTFLPIIPIIRTNL